MKNEAFAPTPELLAKMDAWWRAANYLSACQLYLLDNPLLERPLKKSHHKQTIVGHSGTCPARTSSTRTSTASSTNMTST